MTEEPRIDHPDEAPPSLGEELSAPTSDFDARLEAEDATGDLTNPQVFGRLFLDKLYRILKVGSIYSIQHNQTKIAADEFMEFFDEAARQTREDSFSIVVQDELVVVNGETLRLHRRAQSRLLELRDLFAAAVIRGVQLDSSMSADNFLTFVGELARVAKTRQKGDDVSMEGIEIPSIDIQHGPPTRNILEALAKVNKSMYVAHVYIRGLVKVGNMHEQVRERRDPNIPTGVIRRILQTVTDLLGDEDFTILGLLPLRLVPPGLGTHSFNSSIYAMLLGDRIGLSPQLVAYLGMAVIYQDIDRLVGVSVSQRDRESSLDPRRQFSANLRDVAQLLPRVHGDVISTLRILLTYERGCSSSDPISRPFYRSPRKLHLVTRIIDLCRTYDLLIQGLEGYKTRRPDLAMQYIENRAGEAFDPHLTELFVSTLGVYPIGSLVELTSGERAIVIRTPEPASDPRRPVVRLMDQESVVIDLADPKYSNIEIARTVQAEEQDFNASQVFLLS